MNAQATPSGEKDSDWLCLSVQDFFGSLNWQGTPQSQTTNGHRRDAVKSLTQTVGEFFQTFIWEGTPEVGQLPSHSGAAPAQTPPEEDDVTIEDLVNLF
ncbi:MAG: hypothetical protein ACP5D7_12395 [Limnospira sp.]